MDQLDDLHIFFLYDLLSHYLLLLFYSPRELISVNKTMYNIYKVRSLKMKIDNTEKRLNILTRDNT